MIVIIRRWFPKGGLRISNHIWVGMQMGKDASAFQSLKVAVISLAGRFDQVSLSVKMVSGRKWLKCFNSIFAVEVSALIALIRRSNMKFAVLMIWWKGSFLILRKRLCFLENNTTLNSLPRYVVWCIEVPMLKRKGSGEYWIWRLRWIHLVSESIQNRKSSYSLLS